MMKGSNKPNIYGKYNKQSFLLNNLKEKKLASKKTKTKKRIKPVRHTFLCGGKLNSY